MNSLMQTIECKIKDMDYNITYEIDQDNAHIFQILSKNTVICIAVIYITESIIIQKEKEIDMQVFSINWIKTTNKYKCQGFATMLLIYSICYLKRKYPDIQYAKLDDVTDNSTCRQHNLYNRIGFVFQKKPKMDPNDSEKLLIEGPEKQLFVDKRFVNLALRALNM
jgi:hypothetical protein